MEWKRKSVAEHLVVHTREGVPFLSFPALEAFDEISHGFSTRLGGVSQGMFSTMNFTFTRGDDLEHIMENYRRMGGALNVNPNRMVLSHQTHTTNVRTIREEDAGKGIRTERDYTDVDGLITDVPGITLVTFYADCVPLYFFDPVHKVIGLSHSGWRGTVNRMGAVTLTAMNREYGTRAEDVTACIGPSICKDCFEVGAEVTAEFHKNFDSRYWPELSYEKDGGKHQLDLWLANEIVLREAGVRAEQIHVTDICTRCNPELLFSHRVMGNERGNLAAFLCIR